MQDIDHIIKVLREVQYALKQEDYFLIKELSNNLIHSASIEQDPDVISTAVIIYSLNKMIQREEYKNYKIWPNFYKKYINFLNDALKSLEKKDIDGFRSKIKNIRTLIQDLSGNLKNYISDVFRKASINKASKIYDHGISMGKTAEILGISVWELAEYAGQLRTENQDLTITKPIKERIKITQDVFR